MARVLHGGRISLLVGLIATLVSFLIGVSYGAISGYFGGRIDNAMMRFVDVLYSLPYMFLVILLLVFFSRSILMLFFSTSPNLYALSPSSSRRCCRRRRWGFSISFSGRWRSRGRNRGSGSRRRFGVGCRMGMCSGSRRRFSRGSRNRRNRA